MINLLYQYSGEIIAGIVSSAMTESVINFATKRKKLKKGLYSFSNLFLVDNAYCFTNISDFQREISDFLIKVLSDDFSFSKKIKDDIQQLVIDTKAFLKEEENFGNFHKQYKKKSDSMKIAESVHIKQQNAHKIYFMLFKRTHPIRWVTYAIGGVSPLPKVNDIVFELFLLRNCTITTRLGEKITGCLINYGTQEILIKCKTDKNELKINKELIINIE